MVASVASSRSAASVVPIHAEIARGRGRQEIEAEIGRRGPVGQRRRRVLLEIVRRQHVVGRRDEGFENRQVRRATRLSACASASLSGVRRRRGRQAYESRDRGDTSQSARTAARPARSLARRERNKRRHRAEEHRRPFGARNPSDRAVARSSPGGRGPFKQMARLTLSRQRPADRVGHEPRLMREERDGERRSVSARTAIAAERAQIGYDVATPNRRGGMAVRTGMSGAKRSSGRQTRPQHEQATAGSNRPPRPGPPRRRQRAAQIIQHLPSANHRDLAVDARFAVPSARDRISTAAVASRLAPSADGARRRRRTVQGIRRRPRCPTRDPRARNAFEEIVAEQGRVRNSSGERGLRRHRRRRCPYRRRTLRRTDPGRRRRRRRRRGRCRLRSRRSAGTVNLRVRSAATA